MNRERYETKNVVVYVELQVSGLYCPQAWQPYRREALHSPEHSITASMLQDGINFRFTL